MLNNLPSETEVLLQNKLPEEKLALSLKYNSKTELSKRKKKKEKSSCITYFLSYINDKELELTSISFSTLKGTPCLPHITKHKISEWCVQTVITIQKWGVTQHLIISGLSTSRKVSKSCKDLFAQIIFCRSNCSIITLRDRKVTYLKRKERWWEMMTKSRKKQIKFYASTLSTKLRLI